MMYWRDHLPPHLHAKYGDAEVTVEIESGRVEGSMSRRALALVQEWREANRESLLHNWRLAAARRPLERIKPLE
ncbi:MAG: DUF4160 domain-containing protein [Planctomycetaceae bacterium]|nr:DUF4160 domain-containing protein [Planctomycetaceae bacterium]